MSLKMRCVLRGERTATEGHGCDGEALFPQWCYHCLVAHPSESELTEQCLIAPTCGSCDHWLHDECGRDYAIRVGHVA